LHGSKCAFLMFAKRVQKYFTDAARVEGPLIQTHQVIMEDPVAPVNLPREEMTEAQRAKVVHLAEEARLAKAA
ncbi:hypothetical protein HAX54_014832, partial [Datura stramonium]|nr:hypothetical protein [Datura stramonium]